MKVAVLGKRGQLGSEFYNLKKNDDNWHFFSSRELNIVDKSNLESYFFNNPFEVIINCTAYTDVDKAETNVDDAFNVNELGVKNIAEISESMNSKLIHFSTDYVFDGKKSYPYREFDEVNPIGIYAKSKLAGEERLKDICSSCIILRTSWLYSCYGNNFVKSMIKNSKSNKLLKVVGDQFGTPTNAADLASATIEIISNTDYQWTNSDIFHYSNEGSCSWYQFAKKLFDELSIDAKLSMTESKNYFKDNFRPLYSVLDKTKIKNTFNLHIDDWKISLRKMLLNCKL